MPADIIDFPKRRPANETEQDMEDFMANLPLGFRADHCEPARLALGWSVEALAFRSSVSPGAIRTIESGKELRRVTMQAIAFAFEAEGLVFFPGQSPFTAGNCRGATPDPRTRDDYHLLE